MVILINALMLAAMIAAIAAIAAWFNTRAILKDLNAIKIKLEIQEEQLKNTPFVKNDLDK
ncbi:hypothetical protein [Virgibacillus sp. LDC-1]|uniref:hypothetical protein n=1 Tax=Virgibacillus sp. LDC-1 TaxID=3039856 RepID=UPI0024DEB966|nr:hypothetical protein [Virgibacillus sp. LDC-1]